MNCEYCGNPLTGKQKKFCSRECKNKYFNEKVRSGYSRNKARAIKWYLVKLKGGECEKCGYKGNLSALSFHHRRPTEKLFEIDARSCANRALDALLNEVEKCQLLCCNCHAETHNRDLYIEDDNIDSWEEYMKDSGVEQIVSS